MAQSGARIGQLERALIDEVEVRLLSTAKVTTFTATVTDVDKRGAHIWIADPVGASPPSRDPAPAPGIGRHGQLVRADQISHSLQFAIV